MILKLAAEIQGGQSALVRLVPKKWIPFHTYELAIMCGKTPILTDYGFARLEISRLQIDFGSTTFGRSGSIERFLSKKVGEAVEDFLKSHLFTVVVHDKTEHSVRFTLSPVGQPLKELECSQHFETSRLTFERVMPAPVPQETEAPQENEAKVA